MIVQVTLMIRAPWIELAEWHESRHTLVYPGSVELMGVVGSISRSLRAVGYDVEDSARVRVWGK